MGGLGAQRRLRTCTADSAGCRGRLHVTLRVRPSGHCTGMSDVALIVLGSVIGALATGGVAAWERRQDRLIDAMVAARVLLGDLYVLEEGCRIVLKIRSMAEPA